MDANILELKVWSVNLLSKAQLLWSLSSIYSLFNYEAADTTSIALPKGQAASTSEFWYLIFFTNVISCHRSKPAYMHHKNNLEKLPFGYRRDGSTFLTNQSLQR